MVYFALLPAVFIVGVLGDTSGNEPCQHLQYVEFGKTQLLNCNFRNFFSIIWYDSIDYVDKDPVIYSTQSVKGGPGYLSGEFDIEQNGSLIIHNVSLRHERNFTVIKLNSSRDSLVPHYLGALVIVKPLPSHPVINKCKNGSGLCLLDFNQSFSVSCLVQGARPAVDLNWFRRTSVGDVMLLSKETVEHNRWTYTTSVTTSENLKSRVILELLVCKSVSSIPLLTKKESFVLVYGGLFDLSSVHQIEKLVRVHSRMRLSCSDNSFTLFVWKRTTNGGDYFENIIYGVLGNDTHHTRVIEGFDVDSTGSLIVHEVNIRHEGIYHCVSGRDDFGSMRSYNVTIYVPPVPENPVIQECYNTEEYCVIPVKTEGSLTCVVNGIRPPVDLEWSVVSTRLSGVVEFIEEKLTVSTTEGTYDISLTSKYVMQSAWQGLVTIECRTTKTVWETFHLSTKVDLLANEVQHATKFDRPWMLSLLALILIPLIALCMAIRKACRKKKKKQAPENKKDEEISLLESEESSRKTQIFKEELRSRYKELRKQMDTNPLLWDYVTAKKPIYIQPKLSWFQSNGECMILTSFDQVMQCLSDRESLVVLEGKPGYGKTTVAIQIAYDWSTPNRHMPFGHFDLLVLLQMKHLISANSLSKAITENLLAKHSGLKEEDVMTVMHQNESVLVILDGLDQHNADIIPLIKDMISAKFKVMVTSSENLQYLHQEITQSERFTLNGFDDATQTKYLEKIVETYERGDVANVRLQLNNNSFMKGICEVPIFFVMLSHLFLRNDQVFEADSFTNFFALYTALNASKFESYGGNELTADDHGKFNQLAFDCFRNNNEGISWNHEELCSLIGQTVCKHYMQIGILVGVNHNGDEEVMSSEQKVKFRHKIFISWYAAQHAVMSSKHDMETVRTILEDVNPSRAEWFCQFTCGVDVNWVTNIALYMKPKNGAVDLIYLCLLEQMEKFEDIKRIVVEMCSKEITFTNKGTRLLHTAMSQILDKASSEGISTLSVHLCECVNYTNDSSDTIRLVSEAILPKLDTVENLTITDAHKAFSRDEMHHIFEYASCCPAIRSVRLCCSVRPEDYYDERLLSKFMEKFVKVSCRLGNDTKQLLQLNLQNGKWEKCGAKGDESLSISTDEVTEVDNFQQSIPSDNPNGTKMCFEHPFSSLQHFCLSCDKRICRECYCIRFQRTSYGCDIIDIKDVLVELKQRKRKLQDAVNSLRKTISEAEKLWCNSIEHLSQYHDDLRVLVDKDKQFFQQKMARFATELSQNIEEKEIKDLQEVENERMKIEDVEDDLKIIKEASNKLESDHLSELLKFRRLRTRVEVVQRQLQQQQFRLMGSVSSVWYKKVPNDGMFALVCKSLLVGGVTIRENQIVHLFDHRQTKKEVFITSFDPGNPRKIYWSTYQATEDKISPVTMSHVSMCYQNVENVLFAIGRTVFVLRPARGGPFDSVKSISSVEIRGLGEDMWINGLYAYYKSKENNGKFLTSIRDSSMLREYKVTGELLRIIETNVLASCISSVAYKCTGTSVDVIALACRRQDGVMLLRFDETMKHCMYLKSPTFVSTLLPTCIIWTGVTWLVLFISGGEGREWQIASYEETGQLTEVCEEGTSTKAEELPVSITRWQNTAIVSFGNGTVRQFTPK